MKSQTRTLIDNEIDALKEIRQNLQNKLEELLPEIHESSPFLNIKRHSQEIKQQCQNIYFKIDTINDKLLELGESRPLIAEGSVWSPDENKFVNPLTKGMDLTHKRRKPPGLRTNYD